MEKEYDFIQKSLADGEDGRIMSQNIVEARVWMPGSLCIGDSVGVGVRKESKKVI